MLPPHEDRKLLHARINQLAGLVIVLFLVLIARLWYLQIAKGGELMDQSEANRRKLLRTRAPRGTILDRKGRVIATSRPQFVVTAVPDLLREDKEALATLCDVLHIPPGEMQAIFKKGGLRPGSPVRVKIDASLETVARIGELRMSLPGVSVELDQIRNYPDGAAVAHIMGYLGEIDEDQLEQARLAGVDYKPGDYVGKAGLEKQYEADLRGVDGGKEIEVNASGRVVRVLGEKPSTPGRALKLTVDRDLQIAAYRALGNQTGAAVAIDPRTGAVLAMVSTPSYDPNIFVKRVRVSDWEKIIGNKNRPLQNRCVNNVYPPGSTFKPIMAIAGLRYGKCNVNTSVSCPGCYYLGRHRFGCWKTHGHVPFMKAIAQSCDVWFYTLGRKLQINKMAVVAREFGLGQATGIDLPRESQRRDGSVGLMPDEQWKRDRYGEKWYPGETLNASIGQGYVLMSPLQQALACGAVASGGKLYRPYLVNQVLGPNGKVLRSADVQLRHTIDAPEGAFGLVQQGMRAAVTSGTGAVANIPDVPVAGKTGSAEVHGKKPHGWFICFAPADNPTIAVAAIVEHGWHGATTAAPVCRAVLDVYFGKKKPQDIGSARAAVSGD